MLYKGTKVNEVAVLAFVEKMAEELYDFRTNEKIVQKWLDQNEIKAYANNNVDNMVEIRFKVDPPQEELLRVYHLAIDSKQFQEVMIGIFLEDFIKIEGGEYNFMEIDEKDFLENITEWERPR